jgi:hypothetical protein
MVSIEFLNRNSRIAGLTTAAYVERLVNADQAAEGVLESLALEGLNSGDPIEVGPGYWEEKHRRLDESMNKTGPARTP